MNKQTKKQTQTKPKTKPKAFFLWNSKTHISFHSMGIGKIILNGLGLNLSVKN